MEPDRFDDVAYRVIEEPAPLPARARLRRRVALVLTSAIVAAGGMAAGADALTGAGDEGSRPAAKPSFTSDGADGRRGDCPAGKGHHSRKHHQDSAGALY